MVETKKLAKGKNETHLHIKLDFLLHLTITLKMKNMIYLLKVYMLTDKFAIYKLTMPETMLPTIIHLFLNLDSDKENTKNKTNKHT